MLFPPPTEHFTFLTPEEGYGNIGVWTLDEYPKSNSIYLIFKKCLQLSVTQLVITYKRKSIWRITFDINIYIKL